MRPWKKFFVRPGGVFFSDRQAVDVLLESGRRYDEIASGFAIYAYVGNDPLNKTDSSGLWVGLDDVAALGGGAVAGVIGQAAADLFISRHASSFRTYAAAAAGAAAASEAALYLVPATGGVGAVPAGAIGGLVYNIVNGANLATAPGDLVIGAATGLVPGVTPGVVRGALESAASRITNSTVGDLLRGAAPGASQTLTDNVVNSMVDTSVNPDEPQSASMASPPPGRGGMGRK
jgi:hypothetical protein